MEEALFETPLYRDFAGLSSAERIPDRVSILRFRHLIEAHELSVQIMATVNATLTAKGLLLKQGTAIDATLIAAPSSTKNSIEQPSLKGTLPVTVIQPKDDKKKMSKQEKADRYLVVGKEIQSLKAELFGETRKGRKAEIARKLSKLNRELTKLS